jgi:hypothetical protein
VSWTFRIQIRKCWTELEGKLSSDPLTFSISLLIFVRRCGSIDLELKEETLNQVKEVLSNDFVKSLQNVFSIAMTVSPLVLLYPRQCNKMVCSRKVLMSVSILLLTILTCPLY